MLIAIPSKGRAGKTKSDKFITSAVLFVPETEVKAYETLAKNKVVGVPQNIVGITKTRNWILDNTEDPHLVFIDDDLKVAGWVELLEFKGKHRKLTEHETINEWEKLFEVTEDLKFTIWGVATHSALQAIYPWKPFIFHTYVTASCMGIINRGIRFDERFIVKEDYELCLRCIVKDGGIVGARYIYWENSHWGNEGGCKDYRTQENELAAIKMLMKMYPGHIRKITKGGSSYSIELDF